MRRTRILLAACLLLGLGVPTAAAQATMTIETEWEHPTYTLPESGRGDVALVVKATVSGTNCAAEQTFTVPLPLQSFQKWAGASFTPPKATFALPAGPVVGERKLADQEVALDIAWDVEGAPRFDAHQDYVVTIMGDDVTKNGGPCLPDLVVNDHRSEPLRVELADRPVVVEELSCSDDPYQMKCDQYTAEPEPNVPSTGPLVLLLIVALAAFVRRRVG